MSNLIKKNILTKDNTLIGLLFILTICCVIMKITGLISWSLFFVFTPIYLPTICILFFIILFVVLCVFVTLYVVFKDGVIPMVKELKKKIKKEMKK